MNKKHDYKKECEELKKQLEEKNKPQIFIDTQDMEERYAEELYQDFLKEENKQIKKQLEELQQENKQLKDLIDTILTFSFFKEECPLNFAFEDNSKEDEAQNIFYSDEYCENNCNSIYKECWLKYFKELQGIDSDE